MAFLCFTCAAKIGYDEPHGSFRCGSPVCECWCNTRRPRRSRRATPATVEVPRETCAEIAAMRWSALRNDSMGSAAGHRDEQSPL